MREYELTIIIQPEISEEGSAAILERVDEMLPGSSPEANILSRNALIVWKVVDTRIIQLKAHTLVLVSRGISGLEKRNDFVLIFQ